MRQPILDRQTLILPQVLEGTAAIVLMYYLVRRWFGPPAGPLAALFLAVTPVSVAMDRGTDTDSCLVLVLLLAAWALVGAVERGSRGLLVVSAGLIGLGFNVKMIEAFGVLPSFAAVYLVGAPTPWRRRLRDLALSGAVLLAVSVSWCLVYDLTPAASRPFVGSSTHNSMLELATIYNGIDRFVPRASLSGARVGEAGLAAQREAPAQGFRFMGTAPAGPLRLASPPLAREVEWLLPFAVPGLLPIGWRVRRNGPIDVATLGRLLWSGWAVAYAVVYSFAGGIFRPYYLLTLAPPMAALAGIGVVALWSRYRQSARSGLLLPAALAATAVWQFYLAHSNAAARSGREVAPADSSLGCFARRPAGSAPP